MLKNSRPLIVFIGTLTATLLVVFGFHYWYLINTEVHLHFEALSLPYIVNYILALTITIVLYTLRERQAHNLGFIYMSSSLLKFAVFFLVFNPIYKADGDTSTLEFGLFFIPYAISLIIETIFLIRVMNKM